MRRQVRARGPDHVPLFRRRKIAERGGIVFRFPVSRPARFYLHENQGIFPSADEVQFEVPGFARGTPVARRKGKAPRGQEAGRFVFACRPGRDMVRDMIWAALVVSGKYHGRIMPPGVFRRKTFPVASRFLHPRRGKSGLRGSLLSGNAVG